MHLSFDLSPVRSFESITCLSRLPANLLQNRFEPKSRGLIHSRGKSFKKILQIVYESYIKL